MLRIRPHHLLDIVTHYGRDEELGPSPYGHALHTVSAAVIADPDMEAEFVVAADDICAPCKHLDAGGRCDDVMRRYDPPRSKQEVNDERDRQLLEYLGLQEGARMTVREFLALAARHTPGIEVICTHAGETQERRLFGLTRGMSRLGIHVAGA